MSAKKRILIIDDEHMICDVVKRGLELIGSFEVSIATNGNDGIRMAKRLKPHLILLDICMPGIDGLEVLKRLKKDEETIEIPVVMLTGVSSELTKAECSRSYNEMYIEKPFDITALRSKIDEVLVRKWGSASLPVSHSPEGSKNMDGGRGLKKTIRFWIPVLLWAAAIFCFSSIPSQYFPHIPLRHVDKIVHFVEYAVLGWLLIRAFKHSRPGLSDGMLIAVSIMLIMAFALSDEWHQTFVPGRDGDSSDVILDIIGAGIGTFLYLTGKIRSKDSQQ